MLSAAFDSSETRVHAADFEFRVRDCALKFTLTFEGNFKTGGRIPEGKHHRRKLFHAQLKRLWSVNTLLRSWQLLDDPTAEMPPSVLGISAPAIDVLRKKHGKLGDFEFVPIISKDISVEAALHFHILRSTTKPGQMADIDNVVKTITDSLKAPGTTEELPRGAQPEADEAPFFVLMEDDKLVSKITSTTDELLQPVNGQTVIDPQDVRMMIEVYIRPNLPTNTNLIFFSDDFEVWDHAWTGGIPDNLRSLSNLELRARVTQCVLRMRVTAGNFRMQQSTALGGRFRSMMLLPEEADRNAEWARQTQADMARTDEQHIVWNSRLRPIALSLLEELQRRVFGDPPYPSGEPRMLAIENGMLAGVDPIGEAANGLESLMRRLS